MSNSNKGGKARQTGTRRRAVPQIPPPQSPGAPPVDAEEFAFEVHTVLGVDLAALDAFIAKGDLVDSDRESAQDARERAFNAYVGRNFDLAMEIVKGLVQFRYVAEHIVPLARRGLKFAPKGRGPGPIRKAVAALLQKQPLAKNEEIWRALEKKPPKGWAARDNSVGRYLEREASGRRQTVEYATLRNICSAERKKLKAG